MAEEPGGGSQEETQRESRRSKVAALPQGLLYKTLVTSFRGIKLYHLQALKISSEDGVFNIGSRILILQKKPITLEMK